jgi:hypothetical protein
MLIHCTVNINRALSALPNVGPYICMALKFLALKVAPNIYDISRLRNNIAQLQLTYRDFTECITLCDAVIPSVTQTNPQHCTVTTAGPIKLHTREILRNMLEMNRAKSPQAYRSTFELGNPSVHADVNHTALSYTQLAWDFNMWFVFPLVN